MLELRNRTRNGNMPHPGASGDGWNAVFSTGRCVCCDLGAFQRYRHSAASNDTYRPARIRVITGNRTTDCIVFLWTITPGGGGPDVRPANERRIQITNVGGIPLEPGSRTLLGGWSEEFGVYAFWDARRHVRFSTRSPSLQVTSETLETANRVGIATYLRPAATGQEVVVAAKPDSLLWYVENGAPLHNAEDDAAGGRRSCRS